MEEDGDIVADIYAAALDEHPWADVVARSAGLLGASSGFLFTTDLGVPQGGLSVNHALPAERIERYLADLAQVDLWYHQLLQRFGALRTGLVWNTAPLVQAQSLRRSRFFADYLAPCEIATGLGVMVGDGSSASLPLSPLCLYRPPGAEPFDEDDAARLRALGRHFTRALQVRQRLGGALRHPGVWAIDAVSTAVVVLARDRRLLLANPAAEALLARPGRQALQAGRLCCAAPGQTLWLERLLAAWAAGSIDDAPCSAVRLSGAPGSGLVARLVPPPRSAVDDGRAVALGFLAEEGRAAVDTDTVLRRLYGLTPMESALVKALIDGLSVEAYADRRGVRPTTVKTQLRAVLAKTGSRRQSDLMRLVFSIV